jgi:hypothetical protein
MTRHSKIAVVLFLLDVGGEPHLLLLHHGRWGDWSLVGGHIEPGETPLETAVRETEEELPPLHVGEDLAIAPLLADPIEWGPVASRSARAPTHYTAWIYFARFLKDPSVVLNRLKGLRLAYVPISALSGPIWPTEVSDILARVRGSTPIGDIPPAWSSRLRHEALHGELLRFAK